MNGKVIINKELRDGFISLLRERFYNTCHPEITEEKVANALMATYVIKNSLCRWSTQT